MRALRNDDRAAVLDIDGARWSLVVGRTRILDARRPRQLADDPAALGMAGIAIARLGLAHADQLAGYLADRASIPVSWSPSGRVLLVVRPDGRLDHADADVAGAVRDVGPATRRRRHRVDATVLAALGDDVRHLVAAPRRCVVGVSTASGPVALPGHWNPGGSVTVDRALLGRVEATLPGPYAVTIDDSDNRRPTAKAGVMLRGDAELLTTLSGTPEHVQELTMRIRRATSWSGFDVTTRQAS